jgi:hypothetical protein
MATLKETVAEKIASLGPVVQEAVATALADQVKEKRVKAVLTALNLKEEKEKELKKIKPEQTFDGEGKVASEFYTKANNDLRKKTQEALTKIEKALNEALDPEKPNYENLFKVVQNKGAEAPKEDAAAE